MRTVSVHGMWDAQEKITSRPERICGIIGTARGASYGGETLRVARSERTRVQRHPDTLSAAFLALSPATESGSGFGFWTSKFGVLCPLSTGVTTGASGRP
jgi:hypothetical protein